MSKFHIKVFIFLLTSLNLNNISTAQNKLLKKIYYENSIGEKGLTTLFYSQDHKNYKAKWELLDGSRYSINYHFLDHNNNIMRKYREFSDSITSNVFYKYDYNGNLIEEYFERSDNVKGITWYHYTDGKKTKAECRGLNGWFYGFINYYYKNDLLVKGVIFKEAKQIGTIDYSYDDQGNLIREFWKFGDKWTQAFTYEYATVKISNINSYSYSNPFIKESKDFIVTKENYEWNREGGNLSFYEYENNKLVRKVYAFDSLKTITTYEYDNKGLLMKSFRNYSDGRKAEFSYHFNDNRQLVRKLFHGGNGFFGSETYEYDENGRLKQAIWDKFDTWITGTITFSHDEQGNLKSGLFKGKNNFDASIDFEVDKNGNLTKIHWNFSFEKTQAYWFKYSKLQSIL